MSGVRAPCGRVKKSKVIGNTRDSASSGTLSFWGPACGLYIRILYFACYLWNSCSSSKLKGHREHAGFGLLRDPLFLAPGMRSVSAFFAFGMFLWNSCSVSKIKGHREHAGVGLLRDPLLLGPGMRSVSAFFAFGMIQKRPKGEALEIPRRPKAGQQGGCRWGSAPPPNNQLTTKQPTNPFI